MSATRLIGAFLMAWPCCAVAGDAAYSFRWEGAGGYVMQGGLSYDPLLHQGELVVASDLTCFFIQGFKDGEPLGHWGLTMVNEETDWRLNMDPDGPQFLVEGMGIAMPQAWNMDGSGTSCGPVGIGLNIGNLAQDICIDGQLIYDSQIDPYRPFPLVRDDGLKFPKYACHGPMLMGGDVSGRPSKG